MITIKITEAKKIVGSEQAAFISFPYDGNLVSILREVSSRAWHPDSKQWEVPVKSLPALITKFGTREITIEGGAVNVAAPQPKEIQNFSFKTNPFAHQIEGLQYGIEHDRFLLGDEQGLGKTKQVIDIAAYKKQHNGYKHCLIICGVNGLKYNWQKEVETHSNEKGWILGTRYKNGKASIGSNQSKLEDLNNLNKLTAHFFLITNVESLRDEKICEKLKALCSKKEIQMVAIDEIHKCKNPTSQQGKAILKVDAETKIAMTGTPLMNTPMDLFIVLRWLGHEKHSFYQFKNHYCVMGGYGGYEVVGYKKFAGTA